MPPAEADLLRLAVFAHESASDPSSWPRFLEAYTRAIDTEVALL